MREVSALVVFGYGGADLHLNRMIQRNFQDKPVEIVERKEPGTPEDQDDSQRVEFWKKTLGVKNVTRKYYDNILNHTDWE